MSDDRRWPNVDRLVARQPWAQLRLTLEQNEIPEIESTLERLRRFVQLLIQWNRSVSNLISGNDEERIVVAHVIPSIEQIGWMKSRSFLRWCDLGSGGGFPAIPMAICGVGESWDMVESRRTKTLFLMRAVSELGLKGMRVLPSRIEDLLKLPRIGNRAAAGRAEVGAAAEARTSTSGTEVGATVPGDPWGEAEDSDGEPIRPLNPPYDAFTSRATMALAPTLEYAARIVQPGGEAFLWKGSRLATEAAESAKWDAEWEIGEARALSIEHSVVVNFKRRNS